MVIYQNFKITNADYIDIINVRIIIIINKKKTL